MLIRKPHAKRLAPNREVQAYEKELFETDRDVSRLILLALGGPNLLELD